MNSKNNLFVRIGVLYVDHLAVTTPTLEATLADYLALPGARLLRGPGENATQRVRYAFVVLPAAGTIEILAPLEASPIARHLTRGGGAYHLCYAVADLTHALMEAEALGAKVIVSPTPDLAFDGRRVAFLHHRAHGLFELLEARPAGVAGKTVVAARSSEPNSSAAPTTSAAPEQTRLTKILLRLFPALGETGVESAALDQTDGWDSASQLVLMMEIESEYDIDIPTGRIAEATNYRKLVEMIEELAR